MATADNSGSSTSNDIVSQLQTLFASQGLAGSAQNPALPGVYRRKHYPDEGTPIPGTGDPVDPHPVYNQENRPETSTATSLGSALDQLLQLGLTDPNQTMTLQQQLIDAGFLDPRIRGYHAGQVIENDPTYKAYLQAMRSVIASGTSFDDLIQQRIADGAGDKFNIRTSSSVNLTNPTTAQGIINSVMERLLGRQPTPDEVRQFSGFLNGQEQQHPNTSTTTYDNTSAQSAAGTAGTIARDGQSSGGVDPTVTAENFVNNNFQTEAQHHSLVGYVQAFEQALKGGG